MTIQKLIQICIDIDTFTYKLWCIALTYTKVDII